MTEAVRARQPDKPGDQVLKAAVLMIVGMLFIPLGDAFAKLAMESTEYSAAGLTWARFVLGAALVVPLAFALGHFRGADRRFWVSQAVRGALLCSAITCIITAERQVPLADAFGAFFIGPVVATILARCVLGEIVRRLEWVAVAIGFVGVLLIVKPGATMAPGIVWALAAGCFYGAYLTATRWARTVGPALGQLAGQLCFGALLLTPFAWTEMMSLGLQVPGLLFGSGVASALGNLLAIMAFGFARAATLTPLAYTQLISATTLGWLVFSDRPDTVTAFGLAVVLVAGLSPLFAHFPFRPKRQSE